MTGCTRRGFLGMAAGAVALRGESAQERGRQIIGKTIQALGGDGFRFMQTRTEAGRAYSFYREQLSGLSIARIDTKYLRNDAPPGSTKLQQVQRQSFGKKLDDAVILTGTEAWEVTYRGARPLGDERVKQFRDTTLHEVFYILRIRINEPGLDFESRGKDVVENQPVEVIDIFDSENRNVTVWIHSDTLLPVKQRFLRWDPIVNDRREEITRYTKYREAGNGVMWPFNVQRERDKEKIFELYSEKVTIGDDLADSLFALPSGAKILKK
jgi:hypothetical protein